MGLTHERVAGFVAAAARERNAQSTPTPDVLVAP
jgi:hypothetical protein